MRVTVKGNVGHKENMMPKDIVTSKNINGKEVENHFRVFKMFVPEIEKGRNPDTNQYNSYVVSVSLPNNDLGESRFNYLAPGREIEVTGNLEISYSNGYINQTIRATNVQFLDKPLHIVVPSVLKKTDPNILADILSATTEPSEVLQMLSAAIENKLKGDFDAGRMVDDRRKNNVPSNPMID